jgi:hypothetical protein
MVCDRCGMPAGTCHHVFDSDYSVQPREQYERNLAVLSIGVSVFIVSVVAVLTWATLG